MKKKSEGFVKLPRAVLVDDRISLEAKVLYALMVDRVGVSERSGWKDKAGKTYIYFSRKEVQKVLGCGHEKAGHVAKELEEKGYIVRKKQGQGKPALIYVVGVGKADVKESDKEQSRDTRSDSSDIGKADTNNTKVRYTEDSYTHQSSYGEWRECRNEVKETIEYTVLCGCYTRESVDAVVEIITEVLCSTAQDLRIGQEMIPREEVKGKFYDLDRETVSFVLNNMRQLKRIQYAQQYLRTALYRARLEMNMRYQMEVEWEV